MQTAKEPIVISKAKDAILYTSTGHEIIDAISSWWVNIHGHSNEYIAKKIYEQAQTLEHCIFAGFTHNNAVTLAERIVNKCPEKIAKAFYSDNGSTAVEVGLKMAFQYWFNKGQTKKKVIAFDDAYHGDTFGAMSVSGRSPFNAPFDPFLFDVLYIPSPADNAELAIKKLQKLISENKDEIACIVYEPLVQGAGGMKMYSPETLNTILKICKENNILLVADEVMVGFYRTGTLFASDQAETKPDIMCLSKGLTGGTIALSMTVCTNAVYEAFLSDDKMKTFFHGHSFTANPVACSSALASLDLLEQPTTLNNINRVVDAHKRFKSKIENHKLLKEVRQTGTIIAFELDFGDSTSYFNKKRDQIYDYLLDLGVLLRPLGNVIYIIPPYCITNEQLEKVYSAIESLLNEL